MAFKVGGGNAQDNTGPADFQDDIDDDDAPVEQTKASAQPAEPVAVDGPKQTEEVLAVDEPSAPASAATQEDVFEALRARGSNTSDADSGLNIAPESEAAAADEEAQTPAVAVPAETAEPAATVGSGAGDPEEPNVAASSGPPEGPGDPEGPEGPGGPGGPEGPGGPGGPGGFNFRSTGGSSLSPEAQRKLAADEKAAAARGHGGGGGGIISGTVGGAGRVLGKAGKLAGKGVMAAGGQAFADKFLNQNDPMHLSNGLFRARFKGFNQGKREIESALRQKHNNIEAFNSAIERSAQGQQLKEMATREKTSFADYLSGLENGSVASPEAQVLYKNMQRDPQIHQLAMAVNEPNKRFDEACTKAKQNFELLAANDSDRINVTAEENNLTAILSKAGEKKPFDLATRGTGPDGEETVGNSKESRKKFEEMIEKMKEAISAILQKIAAKLGFK